jgi:ABC-2 type transport system ATP-binding protein
VLQVLWLAVPAIEVQELTVRYGSHLAVDGVSFTADAGEVVALLGPNGAGKTTTVETIEGYRRPDDGQVRVMGLDPVRQHDRVVLRLGAMPQSSRLYAAIRPLEAVRLFAAYYPEPADPEALLQQVGLDGRRARTAWRRLSGGEQQRLSLALALVGRPQVVVLDEPTAGLDVDGRQLVRALLGSLRQQGVCVLLTTHELDEADRIADRLVIIDQGRLVASGTPDELAHQAGPPQVRFNAPPRLDAAGLAVALGAGVQEVAPGEYVADLDPSPFNIARLTGWLAERDLPLGDLRAGRQRLEDVFLRLTSDEKRAATKPSAQADRPDGRTDRPT